MRSIRRFAVYVAATAVLLAGCSFASGALVAGDTQQVVLTTVNDVLFTKGVPILQAPQCTANDAGDTYTCIGKTVDGAEISGIVTGADNDEHSEQKVVVKIGGNELFSGTVEEVLIPEITVPGGG